MKTLRKNIDLSAEMVAILQIEATLNGHGSLKPFMEEILKNYAEKSVKSRPKVYKAVVERKVKKLEKKRGRK